MFNSTALIIEAVTDRLVGQYRHVFGERAPDCAAAIATAARLALERIALSDALYHNVGHTVMVTLLGTEILRGREIAQSLSPEDWLHMTVALLCHDVGYVRGACLGDTATEAVIDAHGEKAVLPRGVSDAWLTALKPLVYREAVELAAAHAAHGRAVYVVSAALQEIGDCVARELGLDGALGSRAETRDGRFTGRIERRLLGQGKADAIVEFAASGHLDLSASVAYSDSHTDLPFLEAVGSAVAVNPDRRLRRIAADRGWPVRRFSARAFAGD